MIPAALPRSVAIALLRFAIWIAPRDTHDWGHAMLTELSHVEGNWSALVWALGGAGVLAKHAMLALVLPGTHRRTVSSASELFAKERPMRKPALAVIASCVVASLLFFLAPVFRQAFRVSLAQWHDIIHVELRFGYREADQELESLAKAAEQNHDAEALAFVASRHPNRSEAARLADEAVHLDPDLTWVYSTAGTWYEPHSGTGQVAALKQWDPENALAHLIDAQRIGVTVTHSKEFPLGKVEKNPGWEEAMGAAFQAPKLDTYVDRQKQLDHRVLSRYQVNDPFQVASDADWYGFPSYGMSYCSLYAESLLESGRTLESRGDRKAAFEKYLAVARFGQMLDAHHRLPFFMRKHLKEAYTRLEALSHTEGSEAEAAFYAMLADQSDQAAAKELSYWRNMRLGSAASHWNAFLVRLSGLLMLACGVLLLVCGVGVVLRNRSLRWGSLRPSRLTLALGFGAAIGSLLSSTILFVSYRPYAELLQRFLSKGDDAGLSELSNFLGDAQLPLGSQFGIGSWYVGSSTVVFYFWFAVTILCAVGVLIAVLRHMQTRPRATVTT